MSKHRYKVEIVTGMKVGGRFYGSQKTATQAIAKQIAQSISYSHRAHCKREITREYWYTQFKRLRAKAFRRIKPIITKVYPS